MCIWVFLEPKHAHGLMLLSVFSGPKCRFLVSVVVSAAHLSRQLLFLKSRAVVMGTKYTCLRNPNADRRCN